MGSMTIIFNTSEFNMLNIRSPAPTIDALKYLLVTFAILYPAQTALTIEIAFMANISRIPDMN